VDGEELADKERGQEILLGSLRTVDEVLARLH